MRAAAVLSLCSVAILWGADSVPPGPPRPTGGVAVPSGGERFETTVRPFVATYCSGCHNEKVKTAGLNLLEYRDAQAVLADREKLGAGVGEAAQRGDAAQRLPPAVARGRPNRRGLD